MYYSNSPLADFNAWDEAQSEWLEQRPVCCRCNDPIQDELLWEISGDLFCEDCAREEFQRWTDEYI